MNCKYVREHYGVPADIGRRVVVNGKPGIIAEDRGHYIGVNFDTDKPGVVSNCHPTSKVEYGDMGHIRRPSAAQRRYQEFLQADWFSGSFGDWIKYKARQAKCEDAA